MSKKIMPSANELVLLPAFVPRPSGPSIRTNGGKGDL
jgi:hypothetical protein